MQVKRATEVWKALGIMGLSAPFSVESVQGAYRERSKMLHPDKTQGQTEQVFTELTESKDYLLAYLNRHSRNGTLDQMRLYKSYDSMTAGYEVTMTPGQVKGVRELIAYSRMFNPQGMNYKMRQTLGDLDDNLSSLG